MDCNKVLWWPCYWYKFFLTFTASVHSPADLGSKCDIVFSMLAADAALESVFSNYLSGNVKKGSIFIDSSTVYPDLTAKLAAQAEKAGVSFLACPVFGRPDAAMAGKTLVVAAGNTAAKKKVSLFRKKSSIVLLMTCWIPCIKLLLLDKRLSSFSILFWERLPTIL